MSYTMEPILDCGAFTAWTQGVEVDIVEYADFCVANMDKFKYFVNLDCIPRNEGLAIKGDKSSVKLIPKEEIERSAQVGWDNMEYMLSRGIPKDRLIHVFHQGEDFSWLERMREFGLSYVGISPQNGLHSAEKKRWMEECMYYATNSAGMPLMKWHGFAVTDISLLSSFPFYSGDSISFAQVAGFGYLRVPRLVRGKPDFLARPINVECTIHSNPNAPFMECCPDLNLSESERKYVEEHVKSWGFEWGRSSFRQAAQDYKADKSKGEIVVLGSRKDGECTVETREVLGVTNDYPTRAIYSALYYGCVENALPQWPWSYKQKGARLGLRMRNSSAREAKCPYSDTGQPTRLYFATWPQKSIILRNKFRKFFGRDQYRHLIAFSMTDKSKMKTFLRLLEEDKNAS